MANLSRPMMCIFWNFLPSVLVAAHAVNNLDLGYVRRLKITVMKVIK